MSSEPKNPDDKKDIKPRSPATNLPKRGESKERKAGDPQGRPGAREQNE